MVVALALMFSIIPFVASASLLYTLRALTPGVVLLADFETQGLAGSYNGVFGSKAYLFEDAQCTMAVSTEQASSGTNSILVTDRLMPYSGPVIWMERTSPNISMFDLDGYYEVSLMFRRKTATNAAFGLVMAMHNGPSEYDDLTYYDWLHTQDINTSSWFEFKAEFLFIRSVSPQSGISFYLEGPTGIEYYLDDFKIDFVSEYSGNPVNVTTILPGGFVGTPYSQTLTATGILPMVWTVSAGALPDGLSLSSAGLISGTPTTMQISNFTVTASNGISPDATKQLMITVSVPLTQFPSLHQKYASHFDIGTNISNAKASGSIVPQIKHHFNILSTLNAMHPSFTVRQAGMGTNNNFTDLNNYDFSMSDNIINVYKQDNPGVRFRGHSLLWQDVALQWPQPNGTRLIEGYNDPLRHVEVQQKMTAYIDTMVKHYGTDVVQWNVINEGLTSGSPGVGWQNRLRTNSPWYIAYGGASGGADYVYEAFKAARLAANSFVGGNDIKLYYNDYELYNLNKAENVANMVTDINNQWKLDFSYDGQNLIQGVGLQGHYLRTESNLLTKIEDGMNVFKGLIDGGLLDEISITELDVAMYALYPSALPQLPPNPQQLQDQADLYKSLMELFVANSQYITSVTFWGLQDSGEPFLDYNYPLLLDRYMFPKPSFHVLFEVDTGIAPTITTSSLPNGTVGTGYSQVLAATGDTPTWSVTSGGLPAGLSLSGNTISGTPTTANTYHFTVEAVNEKGIDTKSLSITVGKANLTPTTFTDTAFTYSGSEQGPTVSNDHPGLVTISNHRATVVGNYTATASIIDTANYQWAGGSVTDITQPWSIGKANLTPTTFTNTTLTYTGSEQGPTVTNPHTGLVTITEHLKTAVGNYTARASITDTANYQWTGGSIADITQAWSIGRISLTLTSFTNTTLTYTGSQQGPTVTNSHTGLVTLTDHLKTAVGNYTATASIIDTVNYEWAGGSTADITQAWSIGKASLAATTFTDTARTYTGLQQGPTVTNQHTGLVAISEHLKTAVGNYTAVASIIDTVNYQWAGGSTADITQAWSIGKANLASTSFSDTALTYTGFQQGPTITNNHLGLVTVSGHLATDAGNYTATVSINDTVNYQWTGGSIANITQAWSIARANRSHIVSIGNWMKGQAPSIPSITPLAAESAPVTYEYSQTSNFASVSDQPPSDAGTYWVRVVIEQTANYNAFTSLGVSFFVYEENTTFVVTFNYNYEGSTPTYKPVTIGSKVASETPKRNGYAFKGWYADAGLETLWDFDTEITKDITLYAKWEQKPGAGNLLLMIGIGLLIIAALSGLVFIIVRLARRSGSVGIG